MHEPVARGGRAIPGVRKEPEPFFRLSPADPGKAQCFAVKRGEIEHRLDCQFHFPVHHLLEKRIRESGYPVYRIGDKEISSNVVDGPFGSQLKAKEYKEKGVALIRVSNCRTGEILIGDELVYISEEKHGQLIRSEVLPGDVLVTKAGHILGYSAIFPEALQKGNITSHLAAIRPTKKVDPHFLSFFLSSSIGNRQIYRWGNKATRPELNTDEVREIMIPLPPLPVQREMVAEMEQARASRRRKLEQADALLFGLDAFLLDRLGLTLPDADMRLAFAIRRIEAKDGRIDVQNFLDNIRFRFLHKGTYSTKRLGDLAKIVMGQAPEGSEYNTTGDGWPLIAGAADLGEEFPNPDKWTRSAPKTCMKDDIILCIRATIGNMNWADKVYCLGRGVAAIRPKDLNISKEYLFAILYLERDYLASRGTGSTFRQIIADELADCPIPLAPDTLQEEIAKEVARRRTDARRLCEEVAREWDGGAKARFEARLLGGEGAR